MTVRRVTAPHLRRGRNSETIARRWLETHGLLFVEANYRCRYGEIDLLMLDRETLAVIEVRYRKHSDFGGALRSVTKNKQRKIALTTQHFLQHRSAHLHRAIRFDVLALSPVGQALDINWLPQAFYFDDSGR